MKRLLVLGNIRRRQYLLLNIFRVKMDIIIIQQLIKILDNDVQDILLFPALAEPLRRAPSGSLCW